MELKGDSLNYEDSNRDSSPAFRFIDLFAGIGGFRIGFESIGGQCVLTSEWNEKAQETYRSNFPTSHAILGDITQITDDEVPEHDVLLAGFPCQPFSLAGVSKKASLGRAHGFLDETQGTLFFEIARIIEHRGPAVFLMENVKHLERHDKGRTFATIMEKLIGLGYHVQSRVIDARSWVPQSRKRIFILGFKNQNDFDFDKMPLPSPEAGPRLSQILHPEDGSQTQEPPYTEGDLATVASKYVLSDALWIYLQEYAAKHRALGNGFGYGLVGPDDVSRTLSARYYKDGAEILVYREGGNPRRLTPRECARLMGFDEMPGQPGVPWQIPVSDVQAYRQFGNAVVPAVVKHIAEQIREFIPSSGRYDSPTSELSLAPSGAPRDDDA
jgi:DNA (cytosine-5)-methyltransferase 1